jgi:hypothetical protein
MIDDDQVRVSFLLDDMKAELKKARTKFPGDRVTYTALCEEVGELAKALLDESSQRVREEAIQVAVMAMRVVLDGDSSYDELRKERGLDPLVNNLQE